MTKVKSSIPWETEEVLKFLKNAEDAEDYKFFHVVKDRTLKKAKKKGATQQYGRLTLAFYLGKVYVVAIN